jgi:hypothetical protein
MRGVVSEGSVAGFAYRRGVVARAADTGTGTTTAAVGSGDLGRSAPLESVRVKGTEN